MYSYKRYKKNLVKALQFDKTDHNLHMASSYFIKQNKTKSHFQVKHFNWITGRGYVQLYIFVKRNIIWNYTIVT